MVRVRVRFSVSQKEVEKMWYNHTSSRREEVWHINTKILITSFLSFFSLTLNLTLTLTLNLTLTLTTTLTQPLKSIMGVSYLVPHLLPPGEDVVLNYISPSSPPFGRR